MVRASLPPARAARTWRSRSLLARVGIGQRAALWALGAFVFSIPSENGVTIPGVGSLTSLLGVVTFGLAVTSAVRGGWIRLRSPSFFLVAALLFTFWSGCSYFWSVSPGATLSEIVTLAQLCVFAWLMFELCRSEQDRAFLMQAFVLGCYLVIAIAIGTFIGSAGQSFRDVGGRFNPNGFAIVVSLAVPMAWHLALRASGSLAAWLNTIYPLAAVVGVVLAASRGGLVTALVALSVIPLTLPRLGGAHRLAVFVAITAVAWGGFEYAPRALPGLEQNLQRLATTPQEVRGGTLTGRTEIWEAGGHVFLQSPIAGVGAGAFNRAVEPVLGVPRSAHNAFLSVAVGTGVVGFGLYFLLLIPVAVGGLSGGARHLPMAVLLAALMVAMMPSNSETDKFAWFVMALLAVTRPILFVPRGRHDPRRA